MTQATARVGLAHEQDRRSGVRTALDLVRSELEPKLRDQVLVKPNFLSSTNQLASSHVDALRGVLDFLVEADSPPSEVIVAEGANERYSGQAFANFGYEQVVDEYPFAIRLVDLHQSKAWVETPVVLADRTEAVVRMPAQVLDSACNISLAVAKTHDTCIVTLGLKNMIMGTLYGPDRILMHGFRTHDKRALSDEVRILNVNLARLARHLSPDITVIDGTRGLQGNGPGGTDGIDFGVVAASADVYAADAVMAKAMGFDPNRLAQFYYGNLLKLGVSDLDRIEVLGADLDAVTMSFKPHETTDQQWRWSDDSLGRYLAA